MLIAHDVSGEISIIQVMLCSTLVMETAYLVHHSYTHSVAFLKAS